LGVFRFVSYSPGHLPSARTSAGNKKYEYKKKEAAKSQQAVDRRETIHFGDAADVVALRHEPNVRQVAGGCQQLFYFILRNRIAEPSGRPDVHRTKTDIRLRTCASKVSLP